MTTAKQLREQLANIPDDTRIIMQIDDEGNGYRYVNGIEFEAEGDDANCFDGESCLRSHEVEEYGSGGDYTIVAVVY